MDGSITDEEKKKVDEYLPLFNEFIKDNLLIVDESLLNKENITDFKKLAKLYKRFDKQMGGLDFIGYDHINQVDLMFKDLGNAAVKHNLCR